MDECPEIEMLKKLLDESLPEGDFQEIETHVEDCDSCKGTLDRLTVFPGILAIIPERTIPDERAFEAKLKPSNGKQLPVGSCWIPGFEIVTELGHGGHGTVYKARQLGLNRFVAIKVVRYGPLANSHERDRFRTEAEAAARLKHPNIVQIHAGGEQHETLFFAMELLEGGSLASRIDGTPQAANFSAELQAKTSALVLT